MTIDKLKAKHFWIVQQADRYGYLLSEDETYLTDGHTKLSIQFAIEILEKLVDDSLGVCLDCQYWENAFSKIQELKQYLDEKV